MKIRSLLISFLAAVLVISFFANTRAVAADPFFDPEAEFLDFEDIFKIFRKPNKEAIYIINDTDCPIEIIEAEIADRGTIRFKELKEAVSTYMVEVKNNSGRRILTYQVIWSLKHPFEKYVDNKLITNSINVLAPAKTQKLKFTKDKYFRDDAYYEVLISKVLFDDGSTWEAPEENLILTKEDEVKNEINKIEEKSIDEMSKEEILEKFGDTSNGAGAVKK